MTIPLSIELSEDLREYVDTAAAMGGFASADQFVQELIRQEREDVLDDAQLCAKLEQGLASGPAVPVTPRLWEELRQRVAKRTVSP